MIRRIIYNIGIYAINALPVEYRLPKWILFIRALLYGATYNFDIFTDYAFNNALLVNFGIGTAYVKNAKVIYKGREYISLVSANVGHNPETTTGYWQLYNDNFIGVTERILYNGRYLSLTWALNRYFRTTFRQPPYPAPYDNGLGGGTFSDIYITNVTPVYTEFIMYPFDYGSGVMYPTTSSPLFMFDPPVYGTATILTLQINVPVAVWTALGATTTIRNNIILNFVKKYMVAGETAQVATY